MCNILSVMSTTALQPSNLEIHPWSEHAQRLELMLAAAVPAGFPSPAQDYHEDRIDLNRELVRHPEATFCVVAKGHSMIDANLHDGDILVVDRSLQPASGTIAVCVLDGEFTVKRFTRRRDEVVLVAENPAFPAIHVGPEQDFNVWGVVTWILRKADRK